MDLETSFDAGCIPGSQRSGGTIVIRGPTSSSRPGHRFRRTSPSEEKTPGPGPGIDDRSPDQGRI